jgi:hypothetical protein
MYGANLYGANLDKNTKIDSNVAARTLIVPEDGPFFGWKKCSDGVIVKVAIGAKAKRSNSTGRKCRAEYVKDLGHFDKAGNPLPEDHIAISTYDRTTEYQKGKIIRCDHWNENRWEECGGGIHFFITRSEAENY